MVASLCFPHPTLSLASQQTLKDPRGTNVEARRVNLVNWALRIHRNSPQVLNISSTRVFDQIRDPEIPITLCPPILTNTVYINLQEAASWRKRLGARLPPLGSRVRVSVSPCGFRGGRNGVWVGFSRGFSRFPLPQISFHHVSILVSSISFHFIRPCVGASGVVGRHPCYSRTSNVGASSHLIPLPDLVLDTS